MSLLLTLQHGPRTQPVRQMTLETGELVIGRGSDADWQIDDPDMFVSRAHCRITADRDGYLATDVSSSGLYVDEATTALGPGNSVRLRDGMRLRLGDYVMGVDLRRVTLTPPRKATAHPGDQTPHASIGAGTDSFFSTRSEEEPSKPRPAGLPNPFEQPEPGAYQRAKFGERDSQAFDDPFSLDPVGSDRDQPRSDNASREADPFGFNADDSSPADRTDPASAAGQPFFADEALPLPPPQPLSHSLDRSGTGKVGAPSVHAHADERLRAAFLRGMGVDPSDHPEKDAIAEMEKFGRQYRMMMEGLMQLLRKRAEEKGNARVAQTVVGAAEVNPLKFLPTVDDALATLLAERSPGFLAGEPAIADAVRDLANHHVRAWRGVQGALRRMIDRFDPAAIEEELKSSSAIETLFAGGRAAKLWELYRKRHQEIATSAETRFLGEIGADFRDAYEEE